MWDGGMAAGGKMDRREKEKVGGREANWKSRTANS